MEQPITGFHLDDENHWVAELACGHFQHVRHNPPWTERPWVLTEEGRAAMLGSRLNCKKCDAQPPETARPGDPAQDVANPGLVRPPLVYSLSLLSGAVLQRVEPWPFLPGKLAWPTGLPLVVGAIALFASSVLKFKAAGTPVPGQEPTTSIVRTGPYRFSRNPIYLAFSLLQLGIASGMNSVWLLATLVVAVALMHCVVIPREERYLERKFGAEYLDYKACVRRWI